MLKIRKLCGLRSCSGKPLLHGSKKSLSEPGARCQQWKQLFRWFVYDWIVGMRRVKVSRGWNNPGNFLKPPTMNLGGLHRICHNGTLKHRIISSYRLHTCHDHCQTTWKCCLGGGFCADIEASHVIKKGLIVPHISSFPCNQLLTSLVWILPLVNLFISGQIQSFIHIVQDFLGCQ